MHSFCNFRYLYLKDDTPVNKQIWNNALQEYILKGQIPSLATTSLDHITSMKSESLNDQVNILSSISNFHWWQYIRCDGKKSSSDICVNLTDHLLYHPSCEDQDDALKLKYIPKSPRNRIMYYLFTDYTYPGAMRGLIGQLVKLDNKEDSPFPDQTYDDSQSSDQHQAKKRRRYSTKVLKVTPEVLCDNMGVHISKTKNSIEVNRNLYETFREQLIVDGTIHWRKHNEMQNIVIMSDYCPTTGGIKTLSYVHVTSTVTDSDNIFIQCTCQIYNTIKCAGLSQIDVQDDEEVVLDESLTCMHCRFYKEHLHQHREALGNSLSSTSIEAKIRNSLASVNNPVAVMGVATTVGTTKLSIMAGDTVSMIHITFSENNSCFANCQNGECNARLLNKKKIPKSVSMQNQDNLCLHIQTLFANFEILEGLFPDYFGSSVVTDNEDAVDHPLIAMTNTEDENIAPSNSAGNFNESSGFWEFEAKSSHLPKEMKDVKLSRYVKYIDLYDDCKSSRKKIFKFESKYLKNNCSF